MSLFDDLMTRVRGLSPVGVSVVEAQDEAVLEAVSEAEREGFCRPYLVGDEREIKNTMEQHGITFKDPVFVQSFGAEESSCTGAGLVREGTCSILMKGKLPTPTLLHAVLDKNAGLRSGKILSHVACLEVPGFQRFIFVTDGGVVLNPDLEKKIEIIKNALLVTRVLGVERPRIACLAPSEIPTLDSEASVHAAILGKMSDVGVFKGAFVDGPMALDVAVSPESAQIKGIGGEVAGKADVLLAPDVVSGNSIAKSMQYFAHATMGGVIVGALSPIVVISRADTPKVKLYSLAIARSLVKQ